MLGEVIFGFLVGCITVLYYLLTSRPDNDSESTPEPQPAAAARDACTAVFERILEDICRSEELRVSLEGKLQRALNPLSSSGTILKTVTLTGLRYPQFRPRLSNIVQHRTEHADELRVEFDLWTEGTITATVRATVQGSLLPQVPVELVLTVRSIRGHARLIVPPGRDPTFYLSFCSAPRLDMRVEAGKVRVEKLPYVGKLLLDRVHQVINKHLVAPSGGIAFHFPIPKVRKLRFRLLSAPPPPVPPRTSPVPSEHSTPEPPVQAPLEVIATEEDTPTPVPSAPPESGFSKHLLISPTLGSLAPEATADNNNSSTPVLLTSVLPASSSSPSTISNSVASSLISAAPIAVPPTAAEAVSTPPSATAPTVATPSISASPPAPPALMLSSSALFGPRSSVTLSSSAPPPLLFSSALPASQSSPYASVPIPVSPSEPISTPSAKPSSPPTGPSQLPLEPPPIPPRIRSASLTPTASPTVPHAAAASSTFEEITAPVPPPPSRSLRPLLSRSEVLTAKKDEAPESDNDKEAIQRGSASLIAAEARLQPESSVNIGRFIVDDYDLSPSTSPPAAPPRPKAQPPPVPPRPTHYASSFNVDD